MLNTKNINISLISIFDLDFGIRYISSFLKKNGYQTNLIFFNKLRISFEFWGNNYITPPPLLNHKTVTEESVGLLISLLKKSKPTIVGISVSTTAMQTAKIITTAIKNNLDAIVAWGGIHAIIAPEECIKYADIVCLGEGEYPMLELAEKIRNNQPINGIKNLWIRNKYGVEKNEMRDLIDNLDELPFPDFIEQKNKFLIDNGNMYENIPIFSSYVKGHYPIMTSRGCFYECSYCCNSVLRERFKGRGTYVRRRSVENVIEELRLVVERLPVYVIRFWDDIFTFNKEWIDKFCSQYIKKIGKPFICYVHPQYTNRDILVKLAQAGLRHVIIGIQSGSEELTNHIFSRIQSNEIFLSFSNFMKAKNISVSYDLISDNPYETDKDQERTVDLLLALPYPYQIYMYSLCWFPKTPLTQKALADKVIDEKEQEQYTSKALNNFFVYLPLSRTKRDLFWNCIKAMVINRLFPKFLVIWCKKKVFFRKYPGILFLLALNYLRLFINIKVKFKHWKFFVIQRFPYNHNKSIIYLDRDFVNYNFLARNNNDFFHTPEIDFSPFLVENNEAIKKFCLNIKSKLQKSTIIELALTLCPFEEVKNNPFSQKKATWELKLLLTDFQHDIHFDLLFPEMTYYCDGKTYSARLVKNKLNPKSQSGLYSLRLYTPVHPALFAGDLLLNF